VATPMNTKGIGSIWSPLGATTTFTWRWRADEPDQAGDWDDDELAYRRLGSPSQRCSRDRNGERFLDSPGARIAGTVIRSIVSPGVVVQRVPSWRTVSSGTMCWWCRRPLKKVIADRDSVFGPGCVVAMIRLTRERNQFGAPENHRHWLSSENRTDLAPVSRSVRDQLYPGHRYGSPVARW